MTLSSHLIIPFFQSLIKSGLNKKGGLNKPAPAIAFRGLRNGGLAINEWHIKDRKSFPFFFPCLFFLASLKQKRNKIELCLPKLKSST